MSQPGWEKVYSTDKTKLERDTTGVYPPELTWVEETATDDVFEVYQICCEPCAYVGGRLSDNPYHPECEVWFASDVSFIAQHFDLTWAEMVGLLCSPVPAQRGFAYEMLVTVLGPYEFDQYPLVESGEEIEKRLK